MKILATDSKTICALATAHGVGAISIIRLSGDQAIAITRRIAPFLPAQPESHRVYYGILRDLSGRPMDEVLVSYFQAGRSFTGENTLEISCHGSEAIVDEVMRNLILAGARVAERGEFTYRAFVTGRLDLAQAESVLELVQSRSTRATQMALRQLQGEFSKEVSALVELVTWVLANLEANIDFAAEDIEIASDESLTKRIRIATTSVDRLLSGFKGGRMIRTGFSVAFVGAPNVGKSSLLNAFMGEERAIVTPIAGTTRDFVEGELMLEGVRVTLLDTAGLRSSDDEVEKIGIARTLSKLNEVDLLFLVIDATSSFSQDEASHFEQIPWDRTALVVNKIDLERQAQVPSEIRARARAVFEVSATTGSGLSDLRDWIGSSVRQELAEDSVLVSNLRHFECLEGVKRALTATQNLLNSSSSPDLIALELQCGLRALHEILGVAVDDQVMDRVFSEFCLGK